MQQMPPVVQLQHLGKSVRQVHLVPTRRARCTAAHQRPSQTYQASRLLCTFKFTAADIVEAEAAREELLPLPFEPTLAFICWSTCLHTEICCGPYSGGDRGG